VTVSDGRAPSDEEVLACLAQSVPVTAIERAPYAYATSFPLEEVVAHLADGRTLHLILKDLTWDRLLGQARTTKPPFLHEPRRCIDTYARVLFGSGIGPTFYGSCGTWFLVEKVPGVELWQIGDLTTWEAVARWLADFHRLFAGRVDELPRENPHLLRYGPQLLRVWPARAVEAAERLGAPVEHRRRLADVAARYDDVVERLMAMEPAFVHGELYPSNVLVNDEGPDVQVWPIDWEMAGIGSPLLDLAALTWGWAQPEQDKLVAAYGVDAAAGDVLDACRLHYALQWLGWSAGWSPPAEHARDWAAEAVMLAERLGL
jgi:hypothetical protein